MNSALMDALCDLGSSLGDDPIAVFDLETTGVDPQRDRIVEITVGCVEVAPDGHPVTSVYGPQRLNPRMPIPAEATAVHGISDADVVGMPTFAEAWPEFRWCFAEANYIAAYNGRRFDVRMLVAEIERAGDSPECIRAAGIIDPFMIWQTQEPRTLAGALQHYCREIHEEAHGSLADVIAAIRVLRAQAELYRAAPSQLAEWSEPKRDPSWIDAEGKIAWRNGEACLTFGKHAGRSLRDLRREESSFLVWMLSKDFPADTKQIVRDALERRFPVRPEAVQA